MKSLASAGTVEEIRRRMESLRETDVRRWGTMMAAEAVRHLHGSFAMAMGDRAAKPVAVPLPRPVMKYLALAMPMRWPKNVATIPELLELPRLASGFAEEKRELLAVYERFWRLAEHRNVHPMLGEMSSGDWMRWGYLHTDHHLRQFGR